MAGADCPGEPPMPISIDQTDAAAHALRQIELAQRTAAARQQTHGLTGIQIAQAASAGAVRRPDTAGLSATGQSAMAQAVLAAAALVATRAAAGRMGESAGGFLASGFGARADRDFADTLERNLMRPLREQLQAAIALHQAEGGDLTQPGYVAVTGLNATVERGGAVRLGGGSLTVADAAALAGLYDRRGVVLTYANAPQAAAHGAPGVIDATAGGLDWGRLNRLINDNAAVDPNAAGFELARQAAFDQAASGLAPAGGATDLGQVLRSGAIWSLGGDPGPFFPFAGGQNRKYNPDYFQPRAGDDGRHDAGLAVIEAARPRDGGIDLRLGLIQPFAATTDGAA
jgi:hypothetical protein